MSEDKKILELIDLTNKRIDVVNKKLELLEKLLENADSRIEVLKEGFNATYEVVSNQSDLLNAYIESRK